MPGLVPGLLALADIHGRNTVATAGARLCSDMPFCDENSHISYISIFSTYSIGPS